MTLRYDLHTHTTCSDGTLAPAELVARARSRDVSVLALTDHDVTDGVPEARDAAALVGITLVPGVEVSVTWERQTVHVVGLSIDVTDSALQTGLATLRQFRDWRAEEIGRRLAKHRVPGAFDGARRHAKGSIVSRTHFARFLVHEGYVRTPAQAFKQFLCRGRPGHVPGDWASLSGAISWIRGAGGCAVLAHPARYKLSAGKLRKLLGEFRECGGTAIEVVSGNHDAEATRRFASVARDYGFLASVGSDYHGPDNPSAHEKPWADLGRLPQLPEDCVPVWRDWGMSYGDTGDAPAPAFTSPTI